MRPPNPTPPRKRVKARPWFKYASALACVTFIIYFFWWPASGKTLYDDLLIREQGEPNTRSFRYYVWYEGRKISPWHDLPLSSNIGPNIFTFINEVPKGSKAKFEINKEAVLNPIIQDVKKGKLRFYHEPSLVNYGAMPQTWEDPNVKDAISGMIGDNDPLDVLEIGEQVAKVGEAYPVKVLGALGMLDGGGDDGDFEMDWKIIAVRTTDPLAARVNDLLTADSELLAYVEKLMIWFRDYKIPDGKPANKFTNNGQPLGRADALRVIAETHEHWKALAQHVTPNKDNFWLP